MESTKDSLVEAQAHVC